MEKHCIGDGCFSDVTFELDDGQMKAHRAILVARCDVMRAMLAGDFREAHSSVVSTRADVGAVNKIIKQTLFHRSSFLASRFTRFISYSAIYTQMKYLQFQQINV